MTSTIAARATLSQRLARYVCDLRYEDIEPRAIAKMKEHITENVTLALTGRRTDVGQQALRVARILGGDRGDCTIIGEREGAPPLDATFANTTLMRAITYDDVLFPVGVHVGLMTLPVALALGEQERRSGREVLTALIAGYDVIGKLGNPVWAWSAAAPRRPTIPFGPFGGAVVAGKIYGLDAERLTEAIGYAAHSAMGLAEGNLTTHYYSLIARNGLMAALLAREGGVSSVTALEGDLGFYRTFFGELPEGLEASLATLGREFEIMNATTKRYPGTGLNILPVELMRGLVSEHGLTAEKVERANLYLPVERENFAEGHAAPPFRVPGAASSALLQTAIVLLDGKIDLKRYDAPNDRDILDVVRKITVVLEPGHPIRYARIEVVTTDGRTLVAEGDDHQFPAHERRTRMRAEGQGILSEAKLERILDLIDDLESVDDIRELTECFRP